MDIKTKLLNDIKKREELYEKAYNIVSYGRVIDTVANEQELEEYNNKYEDKFDYTVEDVPEEKPQETPKVSKETENEVHNFFSLYNKQKDVYNDRLKFVQEHEPGEYTELYNDMGIFLRNFWNREFKKLSKEAQNHINELKKKKKERELKESSIGEYTNKEIITESQKTEFKFYKTLLEASFNPNVKSSWITQIWFEPNEEPEEDENGEIIEQNPLDPNLKGTVFMRVKNGRTGKVYPTYEFIDVPRKVYIMWRRARSKGKYFWNRMKYNYEG